MISEKLLHLGKQLLAETDLEKILTIALDSAIDIAAAERGMIVFFQDNGDSHFLTARNLNSEDIEDPAFEVSKSIIEAVRIKGEAICLRNAYENAAYRKHSSVVRLKILSVICVPLKQEHCLYGVLYLDNRSVRGVFEAEICEVFVRKFADFISLAAYRAVENRRLQNKISDMEKELRGKYLFESIICHDEKMVQVLHIIAQVADTDAPVMIIGESGTGKELIARALHYNSRRSDKPFVALNCAALPETLLESELFGHERGAFTGAVAEKKGWFECAQDGTIFLDEISEMPAHLQVKLLRILQTGEFSRLGATEIKHCNVRIVSAASRDLRQLIKKEKYRKEFFYRLNVIEISLPPLRERKGDLPILIRHFIRVYGEIYKKTGLTISRKAESLLMNYPFPGNIRELENIIQRAVVLCESDVITPHNLPQNIFQPESHAGDGALPSFREAKAAAVKEFECGYLHYCLHASHGNITQAAHIAKMDVKNFYSKMKKYNLDPHIHRG